MAKAKISINSITPRGTYFIVRINYSMKSGYEIHSNSLRMYYSTSPEIVHGCPYITLDPFATNPADPNILSKGISNDGSNYIVCRVPGINDTPLSMDTRYWLRSFMQVYKTGGGKYKKYRGPKNPIPAETIIEGPSQKLFSIADYSNPHPAVDPDTGDTTSETEYDISWVDFTENIVAPTYDVNYEDVTEDWEDANYVTHRIIPRMKIKGSMDLHFFTKYEYNNFVRLLQVNREANKEEANGCVQLKLQVNNYLDDTISPFNTTDLGDRRCTRAVGMFFLTMENNPWNIPFLGQFDKIEPLHIEIVEA